MAEEQSGPVRRLPRAQRREQILAAATKAFARNGFAATGLDDIAAEAGVTRVILYRHFDSKTDLYQAALDRFCTVLSDHVAEPVGGFTDASIDGLLKAPRRRRALHPLRAVYPRDREEASRDVITSSIAGHLRQAADEGSEGFGSGIPCTAGGSPSAGVSVGVPCAGEAGCVGWVSPADSIRICVMGARWRRRDPGFRCGCRSTRGGRPRHWW